MRYLLITAFLAALLYGSTYQQFRFFTLDNPGGAADAVHYVAMTRDDRPTEPEVRHRWLTPALARLVEPLARAIVRDDGLSIRLAFYIVNFAFSLLAAVILFRVLESMNYSMLLSLLGASAFVSSRITVLVTGTPMADAVYFCAIAIVVCLTLERRALALALLLPILVLSKETIIPFLLLPFMTDLRKSPAVWAGMVAAVATFTINRFVVSGYYPGQDAPLAATILEHVEALGSSLAQLITLHGLHDMLNGFSLLLPLSVAGAWLNARHRYHRVPAFVIATVPIAAGLALLSGNFGRMLFAAFPAVIAYALISLEHAARVFVYEPDVREL